MERPEDGADSNRDRPDQWLRCALETGRVAAWSLDLSDWTVSGSEALPGIFGHDALPHGWDYDAMLGQVLAADRATLDSNVLGAAGNPEPWEFECRIRRPDGEVRWIWGVGRRQLDGDGRVRRASGIMQDITDRKRDADAHALLAAIVESSIDAIVGKDLDGIITSWNPAAEKLFGYSEAEAIGQPVTMLFPPSHEAEEARLLSAIRSGTTVENHETIRMRKDGALIFVSITVSPVRNAKGQVVGASKIARDVTQRKHSEAALRESEAQLRLIAEALPVYIIRMDTDLLITYVNNAYAARFGLRPEEVIGKTLPEMIGEQACHEVEGHLARVFRGEAVQYETTISYQGLGSRFMRAANVPDVDDQGNIRGLVGVLIDLTERKEAEDALKRADRRKDEFLAMLAHELRNPLAALKSAIQLIRARGLPEVQMETSDVIDRQTAHLSRLVDDLLDATRITQGKIAIVKAPIVCVDVVQMGIELALPMIEARKHALWVDCDPQPLWVDADSTRLAQAIGNILTNAAKYTGEGGRIRLSLTRDGNSAVITVEDSGVGIHADLLPHVFDIFTQAERAPDRAQGGLGIGLTLVRKIAELHGGAVSAHSEGPGRGSRFSLRLPTIEAPPAEAPPRAAPVAGPPRRVLVVDDNRDSRQLLGALLRIEGHEVSCAEDGCGALEAARARPPDVILLDIGLPGMDGFEVARALKAHPATRAVTIIAITGYGQAQDREASREAGFDHHLVKPVDLNRLFELLSSVASRSPSG